jgi:hypothetical protein
VFATWRPWLVGVLAIAVVSAAIGVSPAFRDCVHTKKDDPRYHTLRENPDVTSGSAVRLELHAVCVGEWAQRYEGAIGAVATVFIAASTLLLWGAVTRLRRSAETELAGIRNSLWRGREAADGQAARVEASLKEAARAARGMEDVAIAMSEQQNLLRGQQEIMASQHAANLATQRAWVRVAVKMVGPVQFAKGNASAAFTLELLNGGALPAHADRPLIKAYPWGSKEATSSEQVTTERINRYKVERVARGAVVFPQQPVAAPFFVSLRKSEIELASNTLGGFVLAIRGAVRYEYPGSSETHSTTFHVHVLRTPDPATSSGWRAIPTEDGVVPASDLFVTNLMGETEAT